SDLGDGDRTSGKHHRLPKGLPKQGVFRTDPLFEPGYRISCRPQVFFAGKIANAVFAFLYRRNAAVAAMETMQFDHIVRCIEPRMILYTHVPVRGPPVLTALPLPVELRRHAERSTANPRPNGPFTCPDLKGPLFEPHPFHLGAFPDLHAACPRAGSQRAVQHVSAYADPSRLQSPGENGAIGTGKKQLLYPGQVPGRKGDSQPGKTGHRFHREVFSTDFVKRIGSLFINHDAESIPAQPGSQREAGQSASYDCAIVI